ARDGEEGVAAAGDQLAVENHLRSALEGPAVLVRDDHGNSTEPPEHDAPDVRSKLVSVDHVHPLAAKQPYERPPGPEMGTRGAIEAEEPNAGPAKRSGRVLHG